MAVYGQILNETVISKKDVLDPNKVKAILNKKYPKPRQIIDDIIMILTAIIAVIGSVATFGLGIIIFAPIVVKITETMQNNPEIYKLKDIEKIKNQMDKLEDKCKDELSKNPDNKDAKEMKTQIEKSRKEIDNFYKQKKALEDSENYKFAKKIYKESILDYFEKPFCWDGAGEMAPILYTIKFNKWNQNKIIDLIIRKRGSCIYAAETIGLEKEDIIKYRSFKIDNKDEYGVFYHNDEYIVVISPKTKQLFEFNPNEKDVFTKISMDKVISDNGRDWEPSKELLQVDREEGYYLLQKPKDGVKPNKIIGF